MRLFIVSTVITLLAALAFVHAQTTPAPAPAAADEYSVTKPRVQLLKETNYLYTSSETTLRKMQPIIQQSLKDLVTTFGQKNIRPQGAPVFVYHNATGDMDTPFTLDIGFPVAGDVVPPENLKTRKLDAKRSATVLFSGAMSKLGEVYHDLYAGLNAPGMEPGNESREHYLYWEGVDSPNNVVLIQVVLK